MKRRVRVKEAFAVNPPRRFRIPSFIRRRRVRSFKNPFTGLDRFNAMRETDLALRRFGEGTKLPVHRLHRKGGVKRIKAGKRKRSAKVKMAYVRSFIKKGGKTSMRHKRGRPRKRHRITRHFGRRIGVSNVSVMLNPRKRHRKYSRRASRHRNPLSIVGLGNPYRRHRRSRRHRNPVEGILSGGGNVMGTAKNLLFLGITAGVGGIVTKLAPGFLGAGVLTNQWMRYGAQFGVGVVGSMLVGKLVNKQHGIAFGIGAISIITMDLIQGWLLTTVTVPATTGVNGIGYGANASYVPGQYNYPGYPGRVGAFTKQRIPGGINGMSGPYAGAGNMGGGYGDPYHG